MKKFYQAPQSIHLSTLPIPALNFSGGLYTTVDNTMSWPVQVDSGAYQITATVGVFASQAGDASADAGSIFIAAGLPFHLLLEKGSISFAAVGDDAGDVFVVPLR